MWVWSQCKAALFALGLELLLQDWSEKEKKGDIGTITERVLIVVV